MVEKVRIGFHDTDELISWFTVADRYISNPLLLSSGSVVLPFFFYQPYFLAKLFSLLWLQKGDFFDGLIFCQFSELNWLIEGSDKYQSSARWEEEWRGEPVFLAVMF